MQLDIEIVGEYGGRRFIRIELPDGVDDNSVTALARWLKHVAGIMERSAKARVVFADSGLPLQ
jgi:hypothetical protein